MDQLCNRLPPPSELRAFGFFLNGGWVPADDLKRAADGVAINTGQCRVSELAPTFKRSVADTFAAPPKSWVARSRMGAITTNARNAKTPPNVAKGRTNGARQPDFRHGRYVAQPIFSNVSRNIAVSRKNTFGPGLTIATANGTENRQKAGVWSKNIEKAMMAIRPVRAGRFRVNATRAGGPELPIGAVKKSGSGRAAGVHGVEGNTQLKSVHVAFGKRDHWVE